MNIAFLSKKNKFGVEDAIKFLKIYDNNIDIYYGINGSAIPKKLYKKKYDIIISYINPWVLPKEILSKTKLYNINFHPGSIEYPGIGCFNFALYNKCKNFGATAHLMSEKVDSGKIIMTKNFKCFKKDTIDTLSIKTYKSLLIIFKKLIKYFFENNSIPESKLRWKRLPYTRKELNHLARLDIKMNKNEFNRRLKATFYSKFESPEIIIYGNKFKYIG